MSIQIQGWGTAVPKCFATQDDAGRRTVELWGSRLSRPAALPALFRHAGVRTRYSVVLEASTGAEPARQSFFQPATSDSDNGPTTSERMAVYERSAGQLAQTACQAALHDAGINATDIDHLVTVSCSGFSAPGVDIGLIENLPLKRSVTRTHVGFMGCHGAFNGLRAAHGLAAQKPGGRVLLCCVELCSLHLQYTSDPQQIVANSLFGDGAAAVVLSEDATESGHWKLRAQGSYLVPDTRHLMSWRVGNHGFEMTLSPEIPGVIEKNLRPWLAGWLAEHDLAIEDIAAWGIHPGGPRILTASADGLKIERSHIQTSKDVLAEFGNMSAPTVLFILDRFRRAEGTRPCVALAFGPGLAIEAALFA